MRQSFTVWSLVCALSVGCYVGDEGPRPPDAGAAPDQGVTQWDPDACRFACGDRACGAVGRPECVGVSCGACPSPTVCVREAWCYDPSDTQARWTVRAVRASIAPCDTRWDTCASSLCSPTLPDPFVVLDRGSVGAALNTCDPQWNAEFADPYLESALRAGVTFALRDDDSPASPDALCTPMRVQFTDEDFAAGSKTVSCGESTVVLGLRRWVYVP